MVKKDKYILEFGFIMAPEDNSILIKRKFHSVVKAYDYAYQIAFCWFSEQRDIEEFMAQRQYDVADFNILERAYNDYVEYFKNSVYIKVKKVDD